MAELVAIGYPDEGTAAAAAEEARRLAEDLVIEADAIVTIARDADGDYCVTTSQRAVSVDKALEEEIRDMLQPGTSALFLLIDRVTPQRAVESLAPYGGTVLVS